MSRAKRKDSKGRVLRKGESERIKEGRYQYRVNVCGTRHTIYALTLEKLREKEEELHKQICLGRDIRQGQSTLNEMFECYMSTKHKLRSNTKQNYLSLWDNNVRSSALGHAKIGDIRKLDILHFYSQLSAKGLSDGTIRDIHGNLICPTFRLAVESEIIGKNPATKCAEGYSDRGHRDALTLRQQNLYLNFLKNGRYKRWYPLVRFMIETGCRIGEVSGLSWSRDIIWEERKLKVNHQLKYNKLDGKMKFSIAPPKTEDSVRVIPLSDGALEALEEQKRLYEKIYAHSHTDVDGYTDFIFVARTGAPLQKTVVNDALKNSINAYNRKEAQAAATEGRTPELLPIITSHVLRHTACTNMVARGIALDVVQVIMGHSNLDMILKTYNHVKEDRIMEEFHSKSGKIA